MNEIINYEEAYLFACAKESESNLARCYLDMKKQRDELLEALEEMVNVSERIDSAEFFPSAPLERALDAIAKAKGE